MIQFAYVIKLTKSKIIFITNLIIVLNFVLCYHLVNYYTYILHISIYKNDQIKKLQNYKTVSHSTKNSKTFQKIKLYLQSFLSFYLMFY
jgi:hypothetical protein